MATFPQRCFHCNKPINSLFQRYQAKRLEGISEADAMSQVGITDDCRINVMGFVDYDEILALTMDRNERVSRLKNSN